jgi:hypothetical protein
MEASRLKLSLQEGVGYLGFFVFSGLFLVGSYPG